MYSSGLYVLTRNLCLQSSIIAVSAKPAGPSRNQHMRMTTLLIPMASQPYTVAVKGPFRFKFFHNHFSSVQIVTGLHRTDSSLELRAHG